MKIEGSAKEIADLVLALQGQRNQEKPEVELSVDGKKLSQAAFEAIHGTP